MTDYSHILFNKSLCSYACSAPAAVKPSVATSARRALLPAPSATVPAAPPPCQTTADDIALLDSRFPWLRGGELYL